MVSSARTALAERHARSAAQRAWRPVAEDGRARARRVAIGDPQAPLAVFLAVLEHRGLLSDQGWLEPDVQLVCAGDYFDFGGTAQRPLAIEDGLAILAWLASHPPDQVVLIAGNHDLARVGELVDFDDASFAQAHEHALRAYTGDAPDPALEQRLAEWYPSLATAEVAARDFCAFSTAQRELVWALLRARRLRLAHASAERRLHCHAGVTGPHLAALGLEPRAWADAPRVAEALNAALDEAVAAWVDGPLAIARLHRPGSRATGEGGGLLYHRPANPALGAGSALGELLGRRFDPRQLPRGLEQVIGHIGDRKCRQLLGAWAQGAAAQPGQLRHLVVQGDVPSYRAGPSATSPDGTTSLLSFTDGEMSRTAPEHYAVYTW